MKTGPLPGLPARFAWVAALAAQAAFAQAPPAVDGERLLRVMEAMRGYGGAPGGGSARTAFTEANREALRHLAGLMAEAGMEPRIDVAGNLIGVLDGAEPGLAPLATGSHIDTVPNGGHYDGVVGVAAAIEVARALADAGIRLRHPLEVAVWSNEEGGKTGSRALNGSVEPSEFSLPSLGPRSIGQGIRFLGGDPGRLDEARRAPGAIAGYLELHVEQGAVLENAGMDIGVVEGIVGIRRWNVTAAGIANHAGTTPMGARRDALAAAARLVADVPRLIGSLPGAQVGTVGRIEASPGAPNVIPGQAVFSLEIRDLDMAKIDRLFDAVAAAAAAIGEESGVSFRFERFYESPAAVSDPVIAGLIEAAAGELGLDLMRMPSGAGHDAQSLAPLGPIGMIFVPSRAGVSHAPEEFTAPDDIVRGADVLLRTLLAMDRTLP